MTRDEISAEIRRLIAEQSATASYITPTDIVAFIDDGIKDMCIKGKVYEKSSTLTVTTTVAAYDLASDFLSMAGIRNHNGIPLDPITVTLQGSIYLITGKPTCFYVFGKGGATDHKITLVDTPTTAGGGVGTYPYDYYALDIPLAAGNLAPNFPAEKHHYLISYGLYRCGEKMRNPTIATAYLTEYCTGLGIQMAGQGGQNAV